MSEKLKLESMYAHTGDCIKCGLKDSVKMLRNRLTGDLDPNQCWCLDCGQTYYMEIPDIRSWAVEQWKQKGKKEGRF